MTHFKLISRWEKKNITSNLPLKKKEKLTKKREITEQKHFLFFPQCFQRPAFPRSLNRIGW